MIKHFNTAMSAGTSGSTGKKGMGGSILMIGLVIAGLYFGYKYIQKKSTLKVTTEEA